MSYLSTALGFVRQRDELQTKTESILGPSLQEYLDFLPERGHSWTPHHKDSSDFTFTELDGQNFEFVSEEYYHYGEYEKDTINLPFEFVENPEAYKQRILAELKAAEERKKARETATKAEQVEKLRARLAKAEAALAKAEGVDDLIGTVALAKQTGEIRSALNRQED